MTNLKKSLDSHQIRVLNDAYEAILRIRLSFRTDEDTHDERLESMLKSWTDDLHLLLHESKMAERKKSFIVIS